MSVLDLTTSDDGLFTVRKRNAPTPGEIAARKERAKQKPLTSIAYFRASDDQNQMLGSQRTQEDVYREYCEKNGVEPMRGADGSLLVFRDNDVSGWKLNVYRDEFDRMLAELLLGEIGPDILWCLMGSRLSRNSRDTNRVMQLCDKREAGGAGIRIVDHSKPELDTRSDMGKLFLRWVLQEAENDSNVKSVVIAAAKRLGKKEGDPPAFNHQMPWGYSRLVGADGRPMMVMGKTGGPIYRGFAMDWEAHAEIRWGIDSLLKHGYAHSQVAARYQAKGDLIGRIVHQTRAMNKQDPSIAVGTPRFDLPREQPVFDGQYIRRRFSAAYMAGYREYATEHDENGNQIASGFRRVRWDADLEIDWAPYERCSAKGCPACTETITERDEKHGGRGAPLLPRHATIYELKELREIAEANREKYAGDKNTSGRTPLHDLSGFLRCPNCGRGMHYNGGFEKARQSGVYCCTICKSKSKRLLYGAPDGATATIAAKHADEAIADLVEAAVKSRHLSRMLAESSHSDDQLREALNEKLDLERQLEETKSNTRLSARDRTDIVVALREQIDRLQTKISLVLARKGQAVPLLPDDFAEEFRAYWRGEKRLPDGRFADVAWRQKVIRVVFKKITLLPAKSTQYYRTPEGILERFDYELNE